ncbi:MAG: hypothetical protein JSU79_04340 [Dehalococcoidales bacterium]|nr:MAG: hypothetical protein JSU79_04340 [Dehalococcoidales bacterium]
MKNRYKILGVGLCSAGLILIPVSYFVIDSVPFAAVGISAIMIGMTCLILACSHPSFSPEIYQLLLKTGLENTSTLLEGLGLSNKAVYLPSILGDGHQQSLIPLVGDGEFHLVQEIILEKLIVPYGKNPEGRAISVTTPGSININRFESIPGPTADEIEMAVNEILSEILDIADSASVILTIDRVYVTVSNPKLIFEDTWYFRCMGSPIASIIAAISSEALGRPIMISDENPEKKLTTITLEVLP